MLTTLIIVAVSILTILTLYMIQKEKTLTVHREIRVLDEMLEALVKKKLVDTTDIFYTSFRDKINTLFLIAPSIHNFFDFIKFKKKGLLTENADKILRGASPTERIPNFYEYLLNPEIKIFVEKYKREYPLIAEKLKKGSK